MKTLSIAVFHVLAILGAGLALNLHAIEIQIHARTGRGQLSSIYSITPLNGYPSTVDTCNIMDNSECPDCIPIDFNIFKPPQQRTPRYYV